MVAVVLVVPLLVVVVVIVVVVLVLGFSSSSSSSSSCVHCYRHRERCCRRARTLFHDLMDWIALAARLQVSALLHTDSSIPT